MGIVLHMDMEGVEPFIHQTHIFRTGDLYMIFMVITVHELYTFSFDVNKVFACTETGFYCEQRRL